MYINIIVTTRTKCDCLFRQGSQTHGSRYKLAPFQTNLVWSNESINTLSSYMLAEISALDAKVEEAHCKKRKRLAAPPPNLTVIPLEEETEQSIVRLQIQVEQVAAIEAIQSTDDAVTPATPVTIEATMPAELPLITIEAPTLPLPKPPKKKRQLKEFRHKCLLSFFSLEHSVSGPRKIVCLHRVPDPKL